MTQTADHSYDGSKFVTTLKVPIQVRD